MLEIQFHETKRNTIVPPELCFQTSRKKKWTCNALSYKLGLPEVWDLLLWGSGSDKNMKGTCRGDLIYHFIMNLSCIMSLVGSLWLVELLCQSTSVIAIQVHLLQCALLIVLYSPLGFIAMHSEPAWQYLFSFACEHHKCSWD